MNDNKIKNEPRRRTRGRRGKIVALSFGSYTWVNHSLVSAPKFRKEKNWKPTPEQRWALGRLRGISLMKTIWALSALLVILLFSYPEKHSSFPRSSFSRGVIYCPHIFMNCCSARTQILWMFWLWTLITLACSHKNMCTKITTCRV